MNAADHYQIVVIGSGPAGQKAAIQGAKAGKDVLLIDREAGAGGECVHRGTIPSKTLRESAIYLEGLRARSEGVIDVDLPADLQVASLMRRLKAVRSTHERFLGQQLDRNEVTRLRGRARFVSPEILEITLRNGETRRVHGDVIVIATGSRPRQPSDVPIDHENILDSDSILSLIYLPKSLTVLGGGVIACEFASIFAALGVQVTLIDRGIRPLAFLDSELTDGFVRAFERAGGRFLAGRKIESVAWDDVSSVVVTLEGGETIKSEKCLCALGRIAQVSDLNLAACGLSVDARGQIPVDEHGRTSVPHIYAAGDVVGPPALAATAVEQGRRAVRHALGLEVGDAGGSVPIGIYTIPEIASIGLTEAQAIERFGSAIVGRAPFAELARGQINGHPEGLFKLIADPSGKKLLGAQIVGEGATELIHVAQMALHSGLEVDAFIELVFNFPTLAEGYRVAALDIAGRRTNLVARAA